MENILMKSFVILSWGLFPQQRALSLVNSQSREKRYFPQKSLSAQDRRMYDIRGSANVTANVDRSLKFLCGLWAS